jgi:hypothetical protein
MAVTDGRPVPSAWDGGGKRIPDGSERQRMRARREFRDRRGVEVEVLDALVDRSEEGMTVFEVRAAVDADIDEIEAALAALKDDGLISVEDGEDRVVILVDARVVPDPEADRTEERGYIDAIRDRLGL